MGELTRLEQIYSKVDALKREAVEAVKIDKSQLENQFDSNMKVIEWLNKKQDWTRVYQSYEAKRKEAWKKAYEYYRVDYQLKLNSAEEYRNMIETDPSYVTIMTETQAVKDVLAYIDSVIDALKGRAWDLTNLSKYLMWSRGHVEG